jgi:type II secretory pathway pseudopilin PulG
MSANRHDKAGSRPSARGRKVVALAGSTGARRESAFTVIEMLAVVVIISLVATLSLPAIKGLTHSNVAAAATRQLMDDLALARQTAIASRATVYVVFVPPGVEGYKSGRAVDFIPSTNLYTKVYTSYALYMDRSLGAQPGQTNPRYLTEWKTLPNGSFISPTKYNLALNSASLPLYDQPFLAKLNLPLPLADSPLAPFPVPCVAFNYAGALVNPVTQAPTTIDQDIPVAQGSVFYNLVNGAVVPDVVETPPQTAAVYNRVRINWLTGRCRAETPTFQ